MPARNSTRLYWCACFVFVLTACSGSSGDGSSTTSSSTSKTTAAVDATLPSITISAPSNSGSYTTSSATVNVSGTASDNVGVTQVSWSNSRGGSGNATGTTSWSVSNIVLLSGSNIITVTARDAAANSKTATITVTYNASDTVAPSTPTNLTATAASSGQINLAWTASTDNVGVARYQVFRDGSSTALGQPTGASYSDATVNASTTYSYQIRAVDAAGNMSALSNSASATTPAATPVSGDYPAEYNTGYPHGLSGDTRTPVTLTPYTGPCTITTAGTVIDSKDITCRLVIKASNVVVKNSRVRVSNSNAIYVDDVYHLTVMDTELDGQHQDNSAGGISLIGDGSYTLIRVDAHGSGDIARANWGGVAIIDSFLHDPFCLQGSCHNDVIQTTDGNCTLGTDSINGVIPNTSDTTSGSYCIKIVHNRLENPHTQTSNILLKADQGPIHDVLVENNLFNGGGYTVYWYDANFKSTKGIIRNNRFRRAPTGGFWPNGGYWGPYAPQADEAPAWSNNVWDDTGAPVNP